MTSILRSELSMWGCKPRGVLKKGELRRKEKEERVCEKVRKGWGERDEEVGGGGKGR